MTDTAAGVIAGGTPVRTASTRNAGCANQFRILQTKNRDEQNGIPDCNLRRGNDGSTQRSSLPVCNSHSGNQLPRTLTFGGAIDSYPTIASREIRSAIGRKCV